MNEKPLNILDNRNILNKKFENILTLNKFFSKTLFHSLAKETRFFELKKKNNCFLEKIDLKVSEINIVLLKFQIH